MAGDSQGGDIIPRLIAVILQARLDSSRLPGKSLLPLGGRPLVFRVMEALNRVPAHLRILACAEDCVEAFAPLAEEAGFELFAGPKDDVLARYCMAARKYRVTNVVRATGDNPFVFADAAAAILEESLALNADYAGFGGIPVGAGVEAVNTKALFCAEDESFAPYEREHVCPYLYGNPEIFLLHRPLAPVRWQSPLVRLTVDTEEDYERARLLYDFLEKNEKPDERHNGAAIIGAYREIFPEPVQ